MRALMALGALLLLAGCANMKTMEELEMLAAQSGDWSAVEKRERRLARTDPSCPANYVTVCQSIGAMNRCGCASRDDFRRMWRH